MKFLPARLQPYFETACRTIGTVPAVVNGFLFARHFETGAGNGTEESAPTHAGIRSSNPLQAYFDSHQEGPGIWKFRHYFEIYHAHFAKFIGREVHVLEIGVYSGGSLKMWKHYFGSQCHIYGVDIHPECKAYEDDSTKIWIGDQADRSFWKRFKKQVPTVDIVVDDGGHLPHQQLVSLEELFPHLRPGGVYLCEDLFGPFNAFRHYVAGLTHNLNAFHNKPGEKDLASLSNPFQAKVRSVHTYPYVVVIEKRDAPMSEFVAPRHGNQWQPFVLGSSLAGDADEAAA